MQFLAVLKVKPDAPRERLGLLLRPEAEHVWRMTTSGVLRSIHFIKGPSGAVLLLEASDQKEADAHIDRLPMVQEGLLGAEVLPLEPFTGFSALFSPATG